MKANVDLTQSRLFSQSNTLTSIISGFLVKQLFGRFPWSVDERGKTSTDNNWNLYVYGENELVFVGSAEERKQKYRNFKFDTGLFCDCCGIKLTRKPWARHYCLCLKCADDIDKSRKTWKEIDKRYDIRESSDRVVIEMNRKTN